MRISVLCNWFTISLIRKYITTRKRSYGETSASFQVAMPVAEYVDLCSSEEEGADIGLVRKLPQPEGEEQVIDLTPCAPSSLSSTARKDRRNMVSALYTQY